MRDQALLTLVYLAAGETPDRLTPIVVSAIAAVAAIATALIAVFARKPDAADGGGVALVKGLREDVRIRDRRIDQRDREIDRLQALCWSHGIDPRPTPPTTSGGPS